MFIHRARFQVLRSFIAAQVLVCVVLFCIFLFMKKWELLVAVILAIILHFLQIYFWAQPVRVSDSRRWLAGVMYAIVFKYLAFVGLLIVFFRVLPTLSDAKFFMSFIAVFFVAYVLPFWYCGIRQAKFSNVVPKRHFST